MCLAKTHTIGKSIAALLRSTLRKSTALLLYETIMPDNEDCGSWKKKKKKKREEKKEKDKGLLIVCLSIDEDVSRLEMRK